MSSPRFKRGSLCVIIEGAGYNGRGMDCPDWIKRQFVGRVVTLRSAHLLDGEWYWRMVEPMFLILHLPFTISSGRTFEPGVHDDIVISEPNLKLIKGPDIDLSMDVPETAHA